jgi:hypothetical protein
MPAAGQHAPIFLDPGHWGWDVARRLNATGHAPAASDPAVAPMTRQHLAALLTAADSAAPAEFSRLVAGWRRLLGEEAATEGLLAGANLRAGWTHAQGEALAGDGYFMFDDWEGAQPLPHASTPAVGVKAHGFLLPELAWSVHAGYAAGRPAVRSALLTSAVGPLDVWAGRRPLQYGIGRGGATVIGGSLGDVPEIAQRTRYTFQGAGLQVRDPFRFPSVLRFLGPTRIEAALGRMAVVGRVNAPWVAFGRITSTPFSDRLTLGVNRGAIFGGEGVPITPGRLFGLLYGAHGGDGGEFENQVFSTIASFRPPLGRWLPLLLYVEWGMDDTAGAVRDTPGIVAGADLGAVPGADGLALGLERSNFSQSCCGNPIWYRHIFYRGSWADQGRLFAHPLGGHGREWLAHARLDLPAHGVWLRTDLFDRTRGHENVFAPERMGRSRGASIALEARITPAWALRLDGSYERGQEWDSSRLSAIVTRSFVRQP